MGYHLFHGNFTCVRELAAPAQAQLPQAAELAHAAHVRVRQLPAARQVQDEKAAVQGGELREAHAGQLHAAGEGQ